jgi:hypothetical protein
MRKNVDELAKWVADITFFVIMPIIPFAQVDAGV